MVAQPHEEFELENAELAEVLELEIWKPVKDWEGLYEVSNLANVKSLPRLAKTPQGEDYYTKERILKPADNANGYYVVRLQDKHRGKTAKVSHIVAQAFLGEAPGPMGCFAGGWTVNHIDEDTTNNNVNNLEYLTIEDNRKHSSKKRKESDRTRKLKPQDVLDIHQAFAEGTSRTELARKYNITPRYISSIINGVKWPKLHPDNQQKEEDNV